MDATLLFVLIPLMPTALTDFDISGNPANSMAFPEYFGRLLRLFPRLKRLNIDAVFSEAGLISGIPAGFLKVHGSHPLSILQMKKNSISTNGFLKLLEMFELMPFLELVEVTVGETDLSHGYMIERFAEQNSTIEREDGSRRKVKVVVDGDNKKNAAE
jgi:hypothetical protein